MRKFISRETLKTAHDAVTNTITATEKGPALLALYLAEKELTEAIAAADVEPQPKQPRQKRARKSNRTTADAQPEA